MTFRRVKSKIISRLTVAPLTSVRPFAEFLLQTLIQDMHFSKEPYAFGDFDVKVRDDSNMFFHSML